MDYRAQLEPAALLRNFLAHPPLGFRVEQLPSGLPSFVAPFDLLTTADDALRRRMMALPGQRWLARLWHWRTRFVGCTTTEFTPLPSAADASALAADVLDRLARDCALLVVKDLAHDSPLIPPEDSAFCAAFARALQERGCVLLEGMALAWVAIDFSDEADYLSRLSYSRRKDIRRKLRSRQALQRQVWPTGDARFQQADTLACFIQLYDSVYQQSEIQFDQLTPAFLTALLQDAGSGGQVFVYLANEEVIGWNLCYVHGGKLVDKYIGLSYPAAREHNLYFVSWMDNLEYARQQGLSHYVAGWTDTAVKRQLGARFCHTRHAVYLRNPLLRAAFRRLAHHFEDEAQAQEQA